MSAEPIDFDALPWHHPLHGARFKVHRDGARQIRLVEFTSDFVEPDLCTRGHIGYVLDGTLEVSFNGHRVTYPAGSGIFIAAGESSAHKARSVTASVRLVLVEEV